MQSVQPRDLKESDHATDPNLEGERGWGWECLVKEIGMRPCALACVYVPMARVCRIVHFIKFNFYCT